VAAVRKEFNDVLLGPLPPEALAALETVTPTEVKGPDGKVSIKLAAVTTRKNWWLLHMSAKYPFIAKAACRLLSMHATSCAAERNWSAWGRTFTALRNTLSLKRAQQLIFIKANFDLNTYCVNSSQKLIDLSV
jgi:hypothetical protein